MLGNATRLSTMQPDAQKRLSLFIGRRDVDASRTGSKTDCAIFWLRTPTADSPDTGEPTWDDSVLYFETATRERYESDPFKPYQKRLSETDFLLRRVAQLLGGWREAIVELEDFCSDPVRLKNMLAAADQIDEIAPRIKAALHL